MPTKKLIVVHGYALGKDGGLGANRVVLNKAVELFRKFPDAHILLPAAINEDTGKGKPLIFQIHKEYLVKQGIPPEKIRTPARLLSSDTWTEVYIARILCRCLQVLEKDFFHFEIHAIGFFPHSLKIAGCWRIIQKYFYVFFDMYCERMNFYHTSGVLDSWSETIKTIFLCLASTISGIYDIKGELWPARKIKQRRREKFTPPHLQNKVIF